MSETEEPAKRKPRAGPTKTEARVRRWAAAPENIELATRLFPAHEPGASTELPGVPWFRLEMYRDVVRWQARDWFEAIHWRWSVWAAMESSFESPPITKVAHFIRGLSQDVRTGGAPAGHEPAAYGAPLIPAVTELGHEDIVELAQGIDASYPPDRRVLSVDLYASDLAIVAAFEAWLKRQRPLAGRREALTDSDMRIYADSKVIPYLDIRLFELAAGRTLKVGDVANALFPPPSPEHPQVDAQKRLASATRRDARKLLSTDYLRRITAQFATSP